MDVDVIILRIAKNLDRQILVVYAARAAAVGRGLETLHDKTGLTHGCLMNVRRGGWSDIANANYVANITSAGIDRNAGLAATIGIAGARDFSCAGESCSERPTTGRRVLRDSASSKNAYGCTSNKEVAHSDSFESGIPHTLLND